MADPTFDKLKSTIKEVNIGKAPDLDGIRVKLLHYGEDNISSAVYTSILFLRTG